jgi:tetratricopeptide (TPR) repeat protein
MDGGCSRFLLAVGVLAAVACPQRLNPGQGKPQRTAASEEAPQPPTPAARPATELSAARPAATPAPPKPDSLLAGHDLEVGIFYFHRDDYPGALARFQDALFNDPTSAEAACRAGDTEQKLKQDDRARQYWQQCLKLDSEGKWGKAARKALAEKR